MWLDDNFVFVTKKPKRVIRKMSKKLAATMLSRFNHLERRVSRYWIYKSEMSVHKSLVYLVEYSLSSGFQSQKKWSETTQYKPGHLPVIKKLWH